MKKMMFLVGMTGMVGIVELRSPNPGSQAEEKISKLEQENKEIKKKVITLETQVSELKQKVEKQESGSSKGGSPALKPMRRISLIERKGGYLIGDGHLDLTQEEIDDWKNRTTIGLIKMGDNREQIQQLFERMGI